MPAIRNCLYLMTLPLPFQETEQNSISSHLRPTLAKVRSRNQQQPFRGVLAPVGSQCDASQLTVPVPDYSCNQGPPGGEEVDIGHRPPFGWQSMPTTHFIHHFRCKSLS